MKFARWVFLLAAIYGVLALAPMYFQEAMLARAQHRLSALMLLAGCVDLVFVVLFLLAWWRTRHAARGAVAR